MANMCGSMDNLFYYLLDKATCLVDFEARLWYGEGGEGYKFTCVVQLTFSPSEVTYFLN